MSPHHHHHCRGGNQSPWYSSTRSTFHPCRPSTSQHSSYPPPSTLRPLLSQPSASRLSPRLAPPTTLSSPPFSIDSPPSTLHSHRSAHHPQLCRMMDRRLRRQRRPPPPPSARRIPPSGTSLSLLSVVLTSTTGHRMIPAINHLHSYPIMPTKARGIQQMHPVFPRHCSSSESHTCSKTLSGSMLTFRQPRANTLFWPRQTQTGTDSSDPRCPSLPPDHCHHCDAVRALLLGPCLSLLRLGMHRTSSSRSKTSSAL